MNYLLHFIFLISLVPNLIVSGFNGFPCWYELTQKFNTAVDCDHTCGNVRSIIDQVCNAAYCQRMHDTSLDPSIREVSKSLCYTMARIHILTKPWIKSVWTLEKDCEPNCAPNYLKGEYLIDQGRVVPCGGSYIVNIPYYNCDGKRKSIM